MQRQTRFIAINGGEICCAEYRGPDADPCRQTIDTNTPTLVLLHGFTGSHESCEPLASRLLDGPDPKFARILTLDLPGHGATRVAEGDVSMEGAAAALVRVLDTFALERCVLSGYSMGGRFALYFTLSYPDRVAGLVLESASPGLADPQECAERRRRDAELADALELDGLGPFVERWETQPLFAKQQTRLATDVLANQRRIRLAQDPRGLAASLRGMGTGAQPWLGDRLSELRLPVLLVAGSMDEKFRAIERTMHRGIATSRLEIVEDAGHAVQLEDPARMAALLETFCTACCDAQLTLRAAGLAHAAES